MNIRNVFDLTAIVIPNVDDIWERARCELLYVRVARLHGNILRDLQIECDKTICFKLCLQC